MEVEGGIASPPVQTIGPVRAESIVFRVGGELHVGLIAKATFKLAPGLATVTHPRPLLSEDERHPTGTSTRWPSDRIPFRPRGEVLFQGKAYAPPAAETREMLVRLSVQRALAGARKLLVDRRVRVRGDLGPDGQIAPFQEMPIEWERALLCAKNPFGTEHPNLLDPADPTQAVCLGPEHATLRRQRAGITSDDRRELSSASPSLRADFPWAFFQSAPEAQQLPFLVGDEWIGLQGLHPFLPLLETRLPGVNAEARVGGLSHEGLPEGTELRLVADTLLLDGDRLEACIVWRGHFGIADESLLAPMQLVVGLALPGAPIQWPAAPGAPEPAEVLTTTPAGADPPPVVSPPVASEVVPARRPHPLEVTVTMGPAVEQPLSLPFAPTPPGSARPPAAAAPADFPEPEEAAPLTVVLSQPGASPSQKTAPREPSVRFGAEGAAPRSMRFSAPSQRAAEESPTEEEAEAAAVGQPTRSRVPVVVGPEARGLPPLVAFTFPWSLEPPKPVLVVVCKATYDLAPDGSLTPAEEPDLPSGDVQQGEDPLASVLVPSDFAPFKPRADVVLVGTAHAPGGRATEAEVRLRFGEVLDRRAAVLGDRRWQGALSLTPSAPKPFETMPLRWERAFGGPGIRANPVGQGALATAEAPLPNLEDPGSLVLRTSDAPAPICFGPIPAAWPERASLLGTYDGAWVAKRWPFFPADFDWSHFQSAPRAQQIEYPRGDERFVLVGVHPRGPLEGRLPGVRARAVARRTSGEELDVVLRLDTVCFDTDRMRVTLGWRGQLPTADDAASDVVEILVLEEPAAAAGRAPAAVERTRQLARLTEGEALPEALAEAEENRPDAAAAALDLHAAKVRARLERAGVLSRKAPEPRLPRAAPPPPPVPVRPELRALVEARIAEDQTLDSLDLQSSNLQGLSLRGRSLLGTNLKDARLAGTDLSGAWLAGAVLVGADLRDALLAGADLRGADFTGARLEGATLEDARVEGANFTDCRAEGASFERAEGAGATFAGARLEGARFKKCELPDADFSSARLEGARFDDGKLTGVRLYEARAAGTSFDRADLAGARANQANLERATLRGANLEGASLDDAILSSAVLMGARAKRCTFVGARAHAAVLTASDLSEARFQRCDLSAAVLTRSNLMKASFEDAVLTGADLRGANLHGVEVWKAELSGVKLDGAITTQSKLARART